MGYNLWANESSNGFDTGYTRSSELIFLKSYTMWYYLCHCLFISIYRIHIPLTIRADRKLLKIDICHETQRFSSLQMVSAFPVEQTESIFHKL